MAFPGAITPAYQMRTNENQSYPPVAHASAFFPMNAPPLGSLPVPVPVPMPMPMPVPGMLWPLPVPMWGPQGMGFVMPPFPPPHLPYGFAPFPQLTPAVNAPAQSTPPLLIPSPSPALAIKNEDAVDSGKGSKAKMEEEAFRDSRLRRTNRIPGKFSGYVNPETLESASEPREPKKRKRSDNESLLHSRVKRERVKKEKPKDDEKKDEAQRDASLISLSVRQKAILNRSFRKPPSKEIHPINRIRLLKRKAPNGDEIYEVLLLLPSSGRTNFYIRSKPKLPVGLHLFKKEEKGETDSLDWIRSFRQKKNRQNRDCFYGDPDFDAVTFFGQWQWYNELLRDVGISHKDFIDIGNRVIEDGPSSKQVQGTAWSQPIPSKTRILRLYRPTEQEEEQFIVHVQTYLNLGAKPEYYYQIIKTLLFKPVESKEASYKQIRKEWVDVLLKFIRERKLISSEENKQTAKEKSICFTKLCKILVGDLERLQGKLNLLRETPLLERPALASPAAGPSENKERAVDLLRSSQVSPARNRHSFLNSGPGLDSGSGSGSGPAPASPSLAAGPLVSYQQTHSAAAIMANMSNRAMKRAAPSPAAAVAAPDELPQQQSDKLQLPECRQ